MSQQPYHLARDPLFYITMLFFAVVTTAMPAFLGMQLLMPIMQSVGLTLFASVALRQAKTGTAVGILTAWLVVQLVLVALYAWLVGERAEGTFSDGFAYRMAIGEWFFGNGSLPASWSDQAFNRLIELIGVPLGALVSGGLAGVWFLVRAVNLAGYSIGILWRESDSLSIGLWAGLPIWTLLRVGGYIGLIATLSTPLYTGNWSVSGLFSSHRRLLLGSITLVVLGIVLELVLPNLWRAMLYSALA